MNEVRGGREFSCEASRKVTPRLNLRQSAEVSTGKLKPMQMSKTVRIERAIQQFQRVPNYRALIGNPPSGRNMSISEVPPSAVIDYAFRDGRPGATRGGHRGVLP